MPKHDENGWNAKFIYSGGGGRGFREGFKSSDFRYTLQKNRSIEKKYKWFKPYERLGDGVAMSRDPLQQTSGPRRLLTGRDNWHNKRLNNSKRGDFIFGPSWHKIMIFDVNGENAISLLQSTCRVPFVPMAYSVLGRHMVFFVEDRTIAEALAECSGKISVGDNQLIKLKIQPSGLPPTPNFDIQCETKVRAEIERRYNGQLQTLCLSNFVMSPDLITEYFLPLTRTCVVNKLFNLLEAVLPNLVGLDLSNNKLVSLYGFGMLTKKAPSLRALNLSKNKFQDIKVLDKLQGLPIVELLLGENPLCSKFTDRDKYIRDVRQRFPEVIKLDGLDVPSLIKFEVAEVVRMPGIRGSSFCNEEAMKVVLAFWQQYVSLYDSDDRGQLMQAYHETATMSMMSSYSNGQVSETDPSKKLDMYLRDSRNLLLIPDNVLKYKRLHQGSVDIITFLQKLPKTTHDLSSCVIDMPVAVENFISFNVVGLIKERDERHCPIRYFSRTFVIVPLNGGFAIVNELLYVTTATPEQTKRGSKTLSANTGALVSVPAVPVPGTSTTEITRVLTEEEERQIKVTSFSQQSGMNYEWSKKCLEENGWNFHMSEFAFSRLKELGSIPPEAFVK